MDIDKTGWKSHDEFWDDIFNTPVDAETMALCEKIADQRDKRIALYKKREKTLWGRFQNWRQDRKDRKAAVNFIMYGPGGD